MKSWTSQSKAQRPCKGTIHHTGLSALFLFSSRIPPLLFPSTSLRAAVLWIFLDPFLTPERPGNTRGQQKIYEERLKFLLIHLTPCEEGPGVIMGLEKDKNALIRPLQRSLERSWWDYKDNLRYENNQNNNYNGCFSCPTKKRHPFPDVAFAIFLFSLSRFRT